MMQDVNGCGPCGLGRFLLPVAVWLIAMAVCPRAEAMQFSNNSTQSVFVYVVVGHDGFTQKKGSFKRDLQPGKSWVYKPGNLHMQAQRDYTFFVWTSFAAWNKAEGFGAFLSVLSAKYHVIDSWLRERSTYANPKKWPQGLLMIGEGFDDDDFWLEYYGSGRTPFAKKGGCTCEGAGWVRSGYGCKGRDWGQSGFGTPKNRPAHPDKACTKKFPEHFAKATYKGKNACPQGAFHDLRGGGECWSCPTQHKRTLHAVTHANACSKPAYSLYKKAVKHRRNSRIGQGCPRGQFWDVKGGKGLLGACYSCAKGYRRTVTAVTSSRSCAHKRPRTYAKATFVEKHGCQKWPGSFFDLRKGGECWACGKDYRRTLTAVTSSTACHRPEYYTRQASTPFTAQLSPP